jgi:hypothetical protein
MIRRWSCINNFNFFFNNYDFFKRFSTIKLLKAVSFRKFINKLTKFNRRKLAKWRRHANWNIYIELFKNWSIDYNFFKKINKFQYSSSFFSFSYFIYDFNYIKKKNPLTTPSSFFHYINNFTKIFYNYYQKKFINNDFFVFLFKNKNTNFLFLNSNNLNSLIERKEIFGITIKSENLFFSLNIESVFKKIINFFISQFALKQILYTYKIFTFFLLYKIR